MSLQQLTKRETRLKFMYQRSLNQMDPSLPFKESVPKGATYPSQLQKLSEANPDKPAFVCIDKDFNKIILTRKDVWNKSRKFAAILRRHGIQKGDIVCNTLVNSPERILTSLGTIVAGAISMHGQVVLADAEDLIHNLRGCKCKAIIADPCQVNGAFSVLQRHRFKDEKTGEILYAGLPDLTSLIVINSNCYQDNQNKSSVKRWHCSVDQESQLYEEKDVKESDTAFIFSTSGTSGFSKQVPHSHFSCLRYAKEIGPRIGVESEETKCLLDNSMGWIGGFPSIYLAHGMTRVCIDYACGKPENVESHLLRMINEEGVHCGGFIPTVLDRLIKRIESGTSIQKRLQTISIGGMPISKHIIHKALDVITNAINVTYVSTECGLMCSYHVEPGTHFKDYCVGMPVQGFEVVVVNENHNEEPTGQLGQLVVRGPTVTSRYTDNHEITKQCFTQDGAFLTGDMAYKDEKGYIYVLCRESNAIHRGAFIHYPGWLESSITNCPGIDQIAVIGVPDLVYHEEICACVIPLKDATVTVEELEDYCKSLFKGDIKSDMSAMPKYFLLFERFPRNSNGKLDRKLLKQDACKRLAIEFS